MYMQHHVTEGESVGSYGRIDQACPKEWVMLGRVWYGVNTCGALVKGKDFG